MPEFSFKDYERELKNSPTRGKTASRERPEAQSKLFFAHFKEEPITSPRMLDYDFFLQKIHD